MNNRETKKIRFWVDIDPIIARVEYKGMNDVQTLIGVLAKIDKTKGYVLHTMRKKGFEGFLLAEALPWTERPEHTMQKKVLEIFNNPVIQADGMLLTERKIDVSDMKVYKIKPI